MPRDDAGVERGRLQAATVPPPVLRESPVPVPERGDAGRRSEKARLIELERVGRANLRAAEEAREQLFEQHRKLERAAAQGSKLASRVDALERELAVQRDEDGRRRGQLKADAAHEARKQVAGELDELVLEVERLRDALAEHDALRNQHHTRLRDDAEEQATLRAELERSESERRDLESKLERATETVRRQARRGDAAERNDADSDSALQEALDARDAEIVGLREQLDEVRRELDREREHTDAAAHDAEARMAELDRALAQAIERARDAERDLGGMRREASDANRARRLAEDACHDAHAAVAALTESLAASEAEVQHARGVADGLRTELMKAAEALDGACAQIGALTAENDTLRTELEKRPAADGVRRHVMAELSALAASTGTEGWRP